MSSNPTFKYNPDTQTLDEVAREKKPVWNPEIWEYWFEFEEAERKYNVHLSSLRHIKCEPGSVWPVGELIEGEDFQIKKGRQTFMTEWVAISINRGGGGDELWDELYRSLIGRVTMTQPHARSLIEGWKNKFTINRRS